MANYVIGSFIILIVIITFAGIYWYCMKDDKVKKDEKM